MQLVQAIESFHLLGNEIKDFLNNKSAIPDKWNTTLQLAEQENPWFTKDNMVYMLESISQWLDKDLLKNLEIWRFDDLIINAYHQNHTSPNHQIIKSSNRSLNIGVVMAGNIPLVGFHDFLCVLLSGNILLAKLSHSDKRLLPFIADRLIEIEPEWKERIHFVEKFNISETHQPSAISQQLSAIIATGSNNTARYFEYYFRNIPHVIRKNRSGVAILNGSETIEELTALGTDIFKYYGLGCRNISKLYVPKGYDFTGFFQAIEGFKDVIYHNKYHSNYVYNRTIYLMDGLKFTDNGFLLVNPSKVISSPIAVLNVEEYENQQTLAEQLNEIKEQIQCVVSKQLSVVSGQWSVLFGETQRPSLTDYADGVDVMKFLRELK